MSGLKHRAEFKESQAPMTLKSLRDALDLLERTGTPEDAAIMVRAFASGGWELSAEWAPDSPAEPEAPQEPITGLPEWLQPRTVFNIHPAVGLEEDPAVIAARVRDSAKFRKIKDNPQA